MSWIYDVDTPLLANRPESPEDARAAAILRHDMEQERKLYDTPADEWEPLDF